MSWTTRYFGGWYLLSVFGFLAFIVIPMLSPYGRIRIGKDDERPAWPAWSWFSMLFTAGMGIGLVFSGVAEPIFHLNSPPPWGSSGEPLTRRSPLWPPVHCCFPGLPW